MMATILDPREIQRARVGPRELKDPRSKAYAIQTLFALKRYAESLRCDQQRVRQELDEIDRYRHWEVLGYASREALLEAELNEQGRSNITAVLEAAPQLDTQVVGKGKAGPGRGKTVDNINRFSGTGRTYLAARLKRDHPDICARIARGEFRSIRAAALAAGIIHNKTPLEQLRHWWRKADAVAQQMFMQEIAGKDDAA